MALISSKGIYGLMAMYVLSQHDTSSPMTTKEIAKMTNVTKSYLEQLLGKLRRAGLVDSVRGSKGGYFLKKEAGAILVKDILFALEEDIKVFDTKTQTPFMEMFMDDINEKILELLDISLKELEKYEHKYNQILHYSI